MFKLNKTVIKDKVFVKQIKMGNKYTDVDLSNTDCIFNACDIINSSENDKILPLDSLKFSLELSAMSYSMDARNFKLAGWKNFNYLIGKSIYTPKKNDEDSHGRFIESLRNQIAKTQINNATPLRQIITLIRDKNESNIAKAVTFSHRGSDSKYIIAIGFTGTGKNLGEWYTNFRFSNYKGFHKGFYQVANYFENNADEILFPSIAEDIGCEKLSLLDIIEECKLDNSRFKLWMSGHSQGAAVMQIFMYNIIKNFNVLRKNIAGVGFASPTVANINTSQYPDDYPLLHIINKDDLVPRGGCVLHFGKCFVFESNKKFRQTCYNYYPEERIKNLQRAFFVFWPFISDSSEMLVVIKAFFKASLEYASQDYDIFLHKYLYRFKKLYKGMEGIQIPFAESIFKKVEEAHISISGKEINEIKVDSYMDAFKPIFEKYKIREIYFTLMDMMLEAHTLTGHGERIGAYTEIVNNYYSSLKPYIWKIKDNAVEKYWLENAISSLRFINSNTPPMAKRLVRGKRKANIRSLVNR